jgi:NADPH:quinone reductase-like Zn-dependent oxidoreductase
MMQAVAIHEHGGLNVLRPIDLPMPVPGPLEIRIRVRAAAVNPADAKWREGLFQSFAPVTFPHILGYDIAGTVDALGSNVTEISVNQPVFAMLNSATKGGYAEYAVLPAADAVPIPAGLDAAVAAAIPTAGLTGVQMIEEYADVQAGQTVLITGAAGSVGRFAVHAANARGARVIVAVRAGQIEEAIALGAAETLVLGAQDWSGTPFDHIIDTVGGADVAALCRHAQIGAGIFTAATTPITGQSLPSEPVFVVVHNDAGRLAALAQSVADGTIAIRIAHRLPLSSAAEAQRLVGFIKVRG